MSFTVRFAVVVAEGLVVTSDMKMADIFDIFMMEFELHLSKDQTIEDCYHQFDEERKTYINCMFVVDEHMEINKFVFDQIMFSSRIAVPFNKFSSSFWMPRLNMWIAP